MGECEFPKMLKSPLDARTARTVFDGLEGVWDAAEREWREANRRREEIEAANVRARREVVDAGSRGVQRVASGVRASALRAGQVVDAVVGNRG